MLQQLQKVIFDFKQSIFSVQLCKGEFLTERRRERRKGDERGRASPSSFRIEKWGEWGE